MHWLTARLHAGEISTKKYLVQSDSRLSTNWYIYIQYIYIYSIYTGIYMLLCCVTLYNLYFYYFALSTERTWFDYISLLIIPCIIYYVTNKETLNLEPWYERWTFFSLVLLFCAVLLVTVLFLFQKAAINNALISKECLCDFMLWNE